MTLRRILTRAAMVAGVGTTLLFASSAAAAGHRGHVNWHHERRPATLFVSAAGLSTNAGTSCAQARYATIQSAIAAAAPGSTVIVCPGVYAEDVSVAEPLTLEGQDAFINATGKINGFMITSSHVTVEGFTVRGATGEGILAQGKADPSLVPAGSPAGSITGIPLTDITIAHNIVQGNDKGSPSYPSCVGMGQVPGDCGEGIHLMSVTHSQVLSNYVNQNSGGILLSDEFGPTDGNLVKGNLITGNASDCGITMPSHNSLAVNPTTLAPNPSLAGVYNNTVTGNEVFDNGTVGPGFGAGILLAAPSPGSGVYGNEIESNVIDGNGHSGVTLHSHAPGAWIGNNDIENNLIGVNNLAGEPSLSPATGPFAEPTKFQSDTQTTGIIVWSLATATPVHITGNTILGDSIGIWMDPPVSDPTAATDNTFEGVTTPVGP